MAKTENENTKKHDVTYIINIALKLMILAVIIGWCFQILRPFINIILWAAIIAITLFPAYGFLKEKFGGRNKIAAGLLIFILIIVLIVPSFFLANSLVDGIKDFSANLDDKIYSIFCTSTSCSLPSNQYMYIS